MVMSAELLNRFPERPSPMRLRWSGHADSIDLTNLPANAFRLGERAEGGSAPRQHTRGPIRTPLVIFAARPGHASLLRWLQECPGTLPPDAFRAALRMAISVRSASASILRPESNGAFHACRRPPSRRHGPPTSTPRTSEVCSVDFRCYRLPSASPAANPTLRVQTILFIPAAEP